MPILPSTFSGISITTLQLCFFACSAVKTGMWNAAALQRWQRTKLLTVTFSFFIVKHCQNTAIFRACFWHEKWKIHHGFILHHGFLALQCDFSVMVYFFWKFLLAFYIFLKKYMCIYIYTIYICIFYFFAPKKYKKKCTIYTMKRQKADNRAFFSWCIFQKPWCISAVLWCIWCIFFGERIIAALAAHVFSVIRLDCKRVISFPLVNWNHFTGFLINSGNRLVKLLFGVGVFLGFLCPVLIYTVNVSGCAMRLKTIF